MIVDTIKTTVAHTSDVILVNVGAVVVTIATTAEAIQYATIFVAFVYTVWRFVTEFIDRKRKMKFYDQNKNGSTLN